MLASTLAAGCSHLAQHPTLLPAELDFYESYDWCLDPHLTIRDALRRLHGEVERLTAPLGEWQIRDVATNIYLLACAVLNVVDEYLRGPTLKLPPRLAATWTGRLAASATAAVVDVHRLPKQNIRTWRDHWLAALDAYLPCFIQSPAAPPATLARAAVPLASASLAAPPGLESELTGVPSPFRRLDLTHHDVLALGQRLVERLPDRTYPILLVGLRTSGSFFAPILRALLRNEGYSLVALVTMQPDKGPGRREARDMRRRARGGFTAVILDDPPHSGGAVLRALEAVCSIGFTPSRTIVLVPIHPARRNSLGELAKSQVVALPPEQWHKTSLLTLHAVQTRLSEYFSQRNVTSVRVLETERSRNFERWLQSRTLDARSERLKRIYEVQLLANGVPETRFVLAKSVGWGWLSYHALLVGHRLTGLVPEILGLRNGILYMEWRPQDETDSLNRADVLEASANLIAARTQRLRLNAPASVLRPQRHQNGALLLAKTLSKAHGSFVTGYLMRPYIERQIAAELTGPCPALIDGKMEPEEWVTGPRGLLKTDFEHHGMGKGELNTTDPAYDLAHAMLALEADETEKAHLIERYVVASGDAGVEHRMFLNQLLAGLWAMHAVRQQLFVQHCDVVKQHQLHRRYMAAWNFLTTEAARACGARCIPSAGIGWRGQLVALDIDGVIDRRIFGFPCTTAAGIKALSLLLAHGRTVILNTARSLAEVEAYCRAYSLAGGVAEHGSCLWDSVSEQAHTLISAEALAKLHALRLRLQQIPGVFFDNRHHHSIRAFTYRQAPRGLLASLRSTGAATAPLPDLMMTQLMTELGQDLLSWHQTSIDTTIISRGVDKGTGLLALRERLLDANADMIAVGDSEPDLPMFRAATQGYAPAHIACVVQAKLLGCQIARAPYQRGLLEITRALIYPDHQNCPQCAATEFIDGHDPWLHVLRAADGPAVRNLLRALQGHGSIRAFLRY